MATVSITYQYSDGDAFQVSVRASGYPDALDQARATAVRAYREAFGLSVEELAGDEE
jgi:hypothetical protein